MPKKGEKETLVLLDAHAIIHRAYHALPDFSSSKGEPTGALYGLSAMLLKLVNDLKPDYLVACYDLPEPTYRHEVYEDYKAGRAEIDENLVVQLDRSRDVFTAFNIPIYEKVGFEADDMLGTIVEQVKKKKNLNVIIASGDMDTLQLVDGKKVQVYTLKKGISDTIIYDEKGVIERFGFKPTLLPDFKGLRGDPSDNIIGIAGIGEKTATILVSTFGTIENMYKTLKKGTKAFEKAGIKPRMLELLKEHEEEALFSKMLAEIRRDVPVTFSLPAKKWEEGLEVEKVLDLFSSLSFRTLSERVKAMFKTTAELDLSGGEEKKKEEVINEQKLEEAKLALWILNSNITNPTLDEVLEFAQTDSFSKAYKHIFSELKKQKLESIYTDIERPLLPVVQKMNERGVHLDLVYLKKLSKNYHKELAKLEKRIHKQAGGEFNINSPKQLGGILFEKLDLKVKNQKKTTTGQKSTRESELEKLKDEHPIIADILAYRELQKLLSTYIDNLPHMVDKDGRLHATFVQTGTTTGRMSSQNPNLQNIPIRTELGRNIRNAFVPTRGFELVSLDYSQIELRIVSFLSGDEKLIRIFKEKGDVHRAVAAEVFNVPEEQVDAEMRRRAKVINFGILYGMGVNALKAALGTDRAEAQQFYNEYFKRFSGLAKYLDHVKAVTARKGYTETLFGRRRYFEGINSTLPYIRAGAERMAINAPMQGTQSDIIKIAMVQIDTYLKEKKLEEKAHLLLQVHDELVYEIEKKSVEKIAKEIKKIMESVVEPEKIKGITLEVDVHIGKNWGEMKPLLTK